MFTSLTVRIIRLLPTSCSPTSKTFLFVYNCSRSSRPTSLFGDADTPYLQALNHLINVKGELPAFLIKPIQRVCKYPLLLDVSPFRFICAKYPIPNPVRAVISRLSKHLTPLIIRTTKNSKLVRTLRRGSPTPSTKPNVAPRTSLQFRTSKTGLTIGRVTIWRTSATSSWMMSSSSPSLTLTENTMCSFSRRSSSVARKRSLS